MALGSDSRMEQGLAAFQPFPVKPRLAGTHGEVPYRRFLRLRYRGTYLLSFYKFAIAVLDQGTAACVQPDMVVLEPLDLKHRGTR